MALTYNIYRDGTKIAEGIEGTTYTDEGLTPNTEYTYEITAENEYGESPKSDPITVTTDYSPVSSIELSDEQVELVVGQTHQLEATVLPSTANQGVSWISADEAVATVDDSGLVTAVGVGEVEVTATSAVDGEKLDTCTFIVSAPETEVPENFRSTGNTDTTADLEWDGE